MITKEQAQKLKAFIENLLVYEAKIAACETHLFYAKDEAIIKLWTDSMDRARINAEETGALFLNYLNTLENPYE